MSWDTFKEPFLKHWKAWWISRHPKRLGEYSWDFLFTKGKQIRPKLFCELWSYLCPDRKPCIELAFLIECTHVVSLILDDLPFMDNADERRGWITLHKNYSIRKALLIVHDIVEMMSEIIKATPLLLEQKPKADIWRHWAQHKVKILWYGQWLDLSKGGSLQELAACKTGILFECVTELVAHFLELDTVFWREWGKTLGILFQWVDDWDDRHEDKRIVQRNAFNESFDETQKQYEELWTKVVKGIGADWWKRPFGQFLWIYFSKPLTPSFHVPPCTSLAEVQILFSSLASHQQPSFSLYQFQGSSYATPGLEFMAFCIPYLETEEKTDIEKAEAIEWSAVELWDLDESAWLPFLTEKQEVKPFVKDLRVLDSLIQRYERV